MMNEIDEIIKTLGLQEHPEGGYYSETYRGELLIGKDLLKGYSGDRNVSTCIYFLLTGGNFSAFHRIKQDEIWHFYDGSTILIHMLRPSGQYECVRLGRNLRSKEVPQYVVPGGTWFASEVEGGSGFGLAGCSVAPGFDFEDFEMASGQQLAAYFPAQKILIERLTRF